MYPSSGMVRAACAASCLLTFFLPLTAQAGGFRAAGPAPGGFHAAPRAPTSGPYIQRSAPQHHGQVSFGHAGGRYAGGGLPNLGRTGFGHTATANPSFGLPSIGYPGRQPLGGPIYGHVKTGPQFYPYAFAGQGRGYDHGWQRSGRDHRRRFASGPLIYPFEGYGAQTIVPQVEPPLVTQYAEPPLQGYYGYYGMAAPTPCVAPVIIQIGPAAGKGRLLPPVVQGGSAGGCGVPQVVTYARADAPPQVIHGVGPAPRGKHKVRARY